jgi:DUF1680 family protein
MQQIFSYQPGSSAADPGPDDSDIIRIDLPVSASLDGDEKLSMRFDDDGTFTITAEEEMKRRIAVRIPTWAQADEAVYEGRPETSFRDGYMVLADTLAAGESVKITFPVHLQLNSAGSDPRYCYLTYGPYILAALSDRDELMPVPDTAAMIPILISNAGQNMAHNSGTGSMYSIGRTDNKVFFSYGEIMFMPFYMVDEQPCHLYLFKKDAKRKAHSHNDQLND